MVLEGKAVLVTGANGGLGQFVTNAFLSAGAQVAGVSRKIQQAEFPNPNFAAVQAEVSSDDGARSVAAQGIARFGKIDTLVHLVGGFAGGASVADTDDGTLERMLDMNFRSALHMIRAVLPDMQARRTGRILAIGSQVAVVPAPMVGAYAASKAALVSLIRTVAVENKDHGITANILLPGTLDTPANRAAMPGVDHTKWVDPAQVAAMLVHLASDRASQISGAAIPIGW